MNRTPMNKKFICPFLLLLVSGCGTQAVGPDEYAVDVQKDIPWDYLSGKVAYSLHSSSGGDYDVLVFILDAAQRKVVYQYAIPTNSSFTNTTAISPQGDSIAFTADYNVSIFKIGPNEVPAGKKTYTANCTQAGVSWQGPGRLSSRGFSYEMQNNSLFINGEIFSPIKGDVSSRAAWSSDGQTAVVCLHDEYSSGSLYLFTLKDSSLIPYFQPRPEIQSPVMIRRSLPMERLSYLDAQ